MGVYDHLMRPSMGHQMQVDLRHSQQRYHHHRHKLQRSLSQLRLNSSQLSTSPNPPSPSPRHQKPGQQQQQPPSSNINNWGDPNSPFNKAPQVAANKARLAQQQQQQKTTTIKTDARSTNTTILPPISHSSDSSHPGQVDTARSGRDPATVEADIKGSATNAKSKPATGRNAKKKRDKQHQHASQGVTRLPTIPSASDRRMVWDSGTHHLQVQGPSTHLEKNQVEEECRTFSHRTIPIPDISDSWRTEVHPPPAATTTTTTNTASTKIQFRRHYPAHPAARVERERSVYNKMVHGTATEHPPPKGQTSQKGLLVRQPLSTDQLSHSKPDHASHSTADPVLHSKPGHAPHSKPGHVPHSKPGHAPHSKPDHPPSKPDHPHGKATADRFPNNKPTVDHFPLNTPRLAELDDPSTDDEEENDHDYEEEEDDIQGIEAQESGPVHRSSIPALPQLTGASAQQQQATTVPALKLGRGITPSANSTLTMQSGATYMSQMSQDMREWKGAYMRSEDPHTKARMLTEILHATHQRMRDNAEDLKLTRGQDWASEGRVGSEVVLLHRDSTDNINNTARSSKVEGEKPLKLPHHRHKRKRAHRESQEARLHRYLTYLSHRRRTGEGASKQRHHHHPPPAMPLAAMTIREITQSSLGQHSALHTAS